MHWVKWGSLLMFLGVVMGAFGGHALKQSLSEEMQKIYHIGVFYHIIHALALFVVAWLSTVKPMTAGIQQAGWAFACGILLFSGSLYALSITGIRTFGMITPLGGLSFLAGWLLLALNAKG